MQILDNRNNGQSPGKLTESGLPADVEAEVASVNQSVESFDDDIPFWWSYVTYF